MVAAILIAMAGTAFAAQPGERASPHDAAFEKGLNAYKVGAYDVAAPALMEAVAKGSEQTRFFAEFYLARIYSDTAGELANQAKAYMLFRKLADENADVDPDDDQRAPFVAKALIALAGYVRSGVREIGLRPNPARAVDYLHHAATFFGDKDAQFELARRYLGGDGSSDDVKRGLHYLSVLTEQSYPAAQALLAELLWRGRHVKRDEQRALALITMAVENAPAHERIWIDEIHQNIFCATTQGTRQEADGIIARWRRIFARPAAEPADRMGLGLRDLQPERKCANGEAVAVRRESGAAPAGPVAAAPPPAAARGEVLKGNAASFGIRDVGAAVEGARKK
jgi:hypothetical protein